MIVLITGASHTGKTVLAQRLLEQNQFPYLSIDLLKMGLIRSQNTDLTPADDEALTQYLWPIVKAMVETAIENNQNLVVEGGYIPFDWQADFSEAALQEIRYHCLVMSRRYINHHFDTIKRYANAIEQRQDDSWYTQAVALEENAYYLAMCQKYDNPSILIDGQYDVTVDLR